MSYIAFIPRSSQTPVESFRVSRLQIDGLVWVLIAAASWILVGTSAWFGIRPLGYDRALLMCVVFLGLAPILNRTSSRMTLRAGLLCEALALLILGSCIALFLSYEMQTIALPLQDSRFAYWDSSLGPHYRGLLRWFDDHDIALRVFHRAYYSFRWQILGTTVVLAIIGEVRKLNIFLGAMLISLFGAFIVGAMFPAFGAVSSLSPYELSTLHWRIDGASPAEHIMQLREGHFKYLYLNRLGGIISFPSFHAATALIVTRTWSKCTYVFVPVCVLNIVMAMATLTHGGHYLVDTIAGLVLATAALYVMEKRNAC